MTPAAISPAAFSIREARTTRQQAELAVDGRRGALHARQPAHDRDRHRLAGDREVLDGLGRLAHPTAASRGIPSPWSRTAHPRQPNPTRRTPPAPRQPDGVVVGHQEARCSGGRAAAHPAAAREPLRRASGCLLSRSAHSSSTGISRRGYSSSSSVCAPRGQTLAQRAHERASGTLPGTSAKAWRTRSAAAGLARTDRRQPRSGVKMSGAARASSPPSPGTAAAIVAARQPARSRASGGGYAGGWASTPAFRADAPGAHRLQEDLRADLMACDQRPGPSTSAEKPPSTSANQSSVYG